MAQGALSLNTAVSETLHSITFVGITQTHYITPDQDKKVSATRPVNATEGDEAK